MGEQVPGAYDQGPLMPDAAAPNAILLNRKLPAGTSRDAWPAVLLGLIVLLVFSPVLHHRFIESWDDSTAILLNPDYNPPRLANLVHYWTQAPAKNLFYVPVTYTLWGLLAMVSRGSAPQGLPFNPEFFYAANLLSHAASSVLVYLILRRLVPMRWAAWLGAALFALHPIQVEAVASAWSVYTPLSAMFGFFAIWQYLIYSEQRMIPRVAGELARRIHSAPEEKDNTASELAGYTKTRYRELRSSGEKHSLNRLATHAWWHYVAATVGFALALLTKPTVVTVPLMVGAIELGLRGRRLRDLVLPLGAWLVMAVVIALINRQSSPASTVFVPDPLLRPMVPLDAIAFYLGKLFVPIHLGMDYGRTPYSIAGKPSIRLTCLLTLALLMATWLLRRRWPSVLAAFAVFVFGLLPAIGIVSFTFQYFSTVADRYVYLAMLGPAIAAAIFLARFPRMPIVVAAVATCTVLAGMSVAQLRHWQDDWKLAAYTFENNPNSAGAVGILEYLITNKGHRDSPDHPLPAPGSCTLDQTALLHLGDLLERRKYHELAACCYRQALQKGTPNAKIYSRLGTILELACKPEEAEQACHEAIHLDPSDAEAHATLEKIAKEIH